MIESKAATGFLMMSSGYNTETLSNPGRDAIEYCSAAAGSDRV